MAATADGLAANPAKPSWNFPYANFSNVFPALFGFQNIRLLRANEICGGKGSRAAFFEHRRKTVLGQSYLGLS